MLKIAVCAALVMFAAGCSNPTAPFKRGDSGRMAVHLRHVPVKSDLDGLVDKPENKAHTLNAGSLAGIEKPGF